MLLIFSAVATLYLGCFLWFRSLCRAAIRSYESSIERKNETSNLIPFERGLSLRVHKEQRAV